MGFINGEKMISDKEIQIKIAELNKEIKRLKKEKSRAVATWGSGMEQSQRENIKNYVNERFGARIEFLEEWRNWLKEQVK